MKTLSNKIKSINPVTVVMAVLGAVIVTGFVMVVIYLLTGARPTGI
jgi:hypothetical protein